MRVRDHHILLSLILALVFQAWNAHAAPLKLIFDHSGNPNSTSQATLRAIPLATSTRDQPEIPDRAVRVPGELNLDLSSTTTWRFELHAPGFWSESVTITPSQQSEGRLVLHPTAQVRGTLTLAGKMGEIPPQARIRFIASATRDREDTGIRGEHECPVETGGFWQCEVPVGTFDLRLRLDGFISHYFWEQALKRDTPHNLGSLALEPGSSLVGWVSTEDREVLGEDCTVVLLPQGTEEATSQRRLETTQADVRGFFHFEGLAPGNYRLVGKKAGYAPAPVDNILIFPGLEANLRETLVLRRPLEPTFLISPPHRPGQQGLAARTSDLRHHRLAGGPRFHRPGRAIPAGRHRSRTLHPPGAGVRPIEGSQ